MSRRDTINPIAESVPFDNNTNSYDAEEVQAAIEEAGIGKHLKNCSRHIFVCKNGNDTTGDGSHHNPYLTICKALSVITDNDHTTRYIIEVGPGEFVEDTITMKQYVSIKGSDTQSTAIKVDTPTKKVVIGSVNCSIYNLTVSDASGAGGVGVFCQNVTGAYGEPFMAFNCIFLNNETHIKVDGTVGTIGVQVNFCRLDPFFTNGIVCTASGGYEAYLYLSNLSLFHRGLAVGNFLYLAGTGVKAFFNSVSCTNVSDSGTGVRLRDGAILVATASAFEGFDKGLWIEDVGAPCSIFGDFKLIDNITYDIQIDPSTAWGNITGVATLAKVLNNASQAMSLNYVDPVTGDFNISRILSTRGFATNLTEIVTANQTTQMTSFDAHAYILTGSTAGQILKLPNATTLRVGHQFWILNESSVNVAIQNYDGTLLETLAPESNTKKALRDNSTTAGVWTISLSTSYLVGKLRDPRAFSMNGTVGNGDWISVSELLPSYKYVFTEAVKLIGMEWSNGSGAGRDFDLVFYKNGITASDIIRTYQVRNSTYDYGSATGWTETFQVGDYMRVMYIDQGDNVSDFGGRFNFEVL